MFDSILMPQSAVIWVMLSSVQSFLSTYLHAQQDLSYPTMWEILTLCFCLLGLLPESVFLSFLGNSCCGKPTVLVRFSSWTASTGIGQRFRFYFIGKMWLAHAPLVQSKTRDQIASALRCVDPPSPPLRVRLGNRFQPMHTLIYQNKRLIILQMLTVLTGTWTFFTVTVLTVHKHLCVWIFRKAL